MTPLSLFLSLAFSSPLFICFCLLSIYLPTSCLLSYTCFFSTCAQVSIYPSSHLLIFPSICPFSSLSFVAPVYNTHHPSSLSIHPPSSFTSIYCETLMGKVAFTILLQCSLSTGFWDSCGCALTGTNTPNNGFRPSTPPMAVVLPNGCVLLLQLLEKRAQRVDPDSSFPTSQCHQASTVYPGTSQILGSLTCNLQDPKEPSPTTW